MNTPDGWKTFDPTSSRNATQPQTGFAAGWRHLIEYLEFKYANAIIAYDAQSRLNLISSIENVANSGLNRLLDLFTAMADTSTLVITSIFALVCLPVVLAVVWYIWGKWRLLRRAHRIGIESLPEIQQLHLARQLGFYDDLVRLLEAHRIVRPPHFTPLEFGQSLSFLPSSIYDRVLRLTHLFYEIRYGGVDLTPARQKRLANVIERLSHELKTSVPGTIH